MKTLKLQELSTDVICGIIAQAAYGANKQYVDAIGGRAVNPTWTEAPYELQQGLIKAVHDHITSPKTPEESHVAWCEARKAQGYKLGKHVNHKKKTHPGLIRYQDLPFEEQLKDALFTGIVDIFTYALAGFVVPGAPGDDVVVSEVPEEQTLNNAVGSKGEGPTVGDDNVDTEAKEESIVSDEGQAVFAARQDLIKLMEEQQELGDIGKYQKFKDRLEALDNSLMAEPLSKEDKEFVDLGINVGIDDDEGKEDTESAEMKEAETKEDLLTTEPEPDQG